MEPAITEKADCIFDALDKYAKDESTRGAFEVGDPEGNRHYRVRTAKGNITTLTVESDDLVLKNGSRLAAHCLLEGSRSAIVLDRQLTYEDDRVVVGVFCSQLASVIRGSERHGLLWLRTARKLAREVQWSWKSLGVKCAYDKIPLTNRQIAKAIKEDR